METMFTNTEKIKTNEPHRFDLNIYRNKMNHDVNENHDDDNNIYRNKIVTSKSFGYKTKLIGGTAKNYSTLHAEFVAPFKYLSNLRRFLNLPIINCEI